MVLLPILLANLILLTPTANSGLLSQKKAPEHSHTMEQLKKTGQAVKEDSKDARDAAAEGIRKAQTRISNTTSQFKDTVKNKAQAIQNKAQAIRDLNLNTATARELRNAFDISYWEARQIIRHRNKLENKRFKNKAQLQEIKTLSKESLNKIAELAKHIVSLN